MIRMASVLKAGMSQEVKWKSVDFLSTVSGDQFSPDVKNHEMVKLTHQIAEAMPKY